MPEGAVYVGRPTRWGNPIPIKGLLWTAVTLGYRADRAGRQACAVELYRRYLLEPEKLFLAKLDDLDLPKHSNDETSVILPAPPSLEDIRTHLGDKNLVCWCPLDAPCHADILLSLANAWG